MNRAAAPNPNGDGLPAPQLPTPSLSPILGPQREQDAKSPKLQEQITEVPEEELAYFGARKEDRLQLDGSTETKLVTSHDGAAHNGRRRQSIRRLSSSTITSPDRDRTLKLSPTEIKELTSEPTSLPLRAASPLQDDLFPLPESTSTTDNERPTRTGIERRSTGVERISSHNGVLNAPFSQRNGETRRTMDEVTDKSRLSDSAATKKMSGGVRQRRPSLSARTVSSPPVYRRKLSSSKVSGGAPEVVSQSRSSRTVPAPLNLKDLKTGSANGSASLKPSPVPEIMNSPLGSNLPMPPISIPTYLQLELSSDKPSPLYINRSMYSDIPYESTAIKYERLLNFLKIPAQIERLLIFGTFVCLDAWLYTFTILPLRFLKALGILIRWWTQNALKEIADLGAFVYRGLGRVWKRRRHSSSVSSTPDHSRRTSVSNVVPKREDDVFAPNGNGVHSFPEFQKTQPPRRSLRHRRTKSTPSTLKASHKGDLLQGFLIFATCVVLMQVDPSRMYHSVRGQAAIKLYVIYNVLEVADKLFSAFGQDLLEYLLSSDNLERDSYGRSKILQPFGMFILSVAYTAIHSIALLYQVLTLNVAVNSYSNALLTLLMSNQFVEVKGSVFKRFEKENLFQITCADIVERFQIWLMLAIIGMRNIVEMGGWSISPNTGPEPSSHAGYNSANTPLSTASIMPTAFNIIPKLAGQVLVPFAIVLGSEVIVDWIKHAYIGKFNNTKPVIYSRFLDVMAKDYYSHAFAEQNLTKRLGLPVIPLACLFIRACIQTYHMFLSTHMPVPLPSTATAISDAEHASPATTAALAHIDHIFRRALGRSSFGAGGATEGFNLWSLDDVIALATMLVVFLIAYCLLLVLKLILGMLLLSFARRRCESMKLREEVKVEQVGKRSGGWGVTEVDDKKREWIYGDDPVGLERLKERDRKGAQKAEKGVKDGELDRVSRYAMVAKRIW